MTSVCVLSCENVIIGVALNAEVAKDWIDSHADSDGMLKFGLFMCHKDKVSITETEILRVPKKPRDRKCPTCGPVSRRKICRYKSQS